MNNESSPPVALIIGASSAIGLAIIELLLEEPQQKVIAVSQQPESVEQKFVNEPRLITFQCDYSPSQIEATIKAITQRQISINQVFILNGLLHGDFGFPEKKLSDIQPEQIETVFKANTTVPLMWLKALETLPMAAYADIVLFSARIGSIEDNRLGGWYSYRASKAALNMVTKTAAIELKRRHKHWGFVLYHPGTTDTPLSEPFQKNVADNKLFTPDFTAHQLLTLMPTLSHNEIIHYVDWQGLKIEW